MKVLLIEDLPEKIAKIESVISEKLSDIDHQVIVANDLNSARRHIIANIFDLIVFDFFLPLNNQEKNIVDVSEELLLEFAASRNYKTEAIVITHLDFSDVENIKQFNEAGVTIVKYSNDDKWVESLRDKLLKIMYKAKYEFLIFCALSKERSAYSETEAVVGELKSINGLDCQEIFISNTRGLILVPSKMGLVHMAILVSKSIEFFKPKIVAMSGICAGIKGESKILDIIVGSLCWEYQTGKITDNEFKQEPYQSPICQELVTELKQSTENEQLLAELKKGLYVTELNDSKILFSPISSGAAVIASETKMKEIGMQHRKMAGVEMEMYAFYEASAESLLKPMYFAAKAVVDVGDSYKGDKYHQPACIISARFVTHFIKNKLSQLMN